MRGSFVGIFIEKTAYNSLNKLYLGGIYMADIQGRHNAILENRSHLVLSGVTDVDSFDEAEIMLYTQLGELTIKGANLHINEMSVESGDLSVEGEISALIYGDKSRKKKLSSLGKIFK